ncbi:energy transducer TonB [Flavobacterium flavipallidum]|uniref:Energy transducer TonB n=1 Tax=Flavobacterium flavipallidum TaxID=3139140 RepID=A0ABU9HKJ5_9FLAO
MTKHRLAFLLLIISNIIFAQNNLDKTIYLDSLWKETSKENCKYYRIVKDYYNDKEIYRFEDYYKNGTLQMEGYSKAKDALISEGEFTYYYENGNKKSTQSYIKGRPSGLSYTWYENGNKKSELEYITQKNNELLYDIKTNQYWGKDNTQSVIDGNGYIDEKEGKLQEKGSIKNGWKEGEWKGTDSQFKISFTENYKNGKLKNGTSIDSLMVKRKYNEVFNYPRPKRGLQHFYSYVAKNFKIPGNKEDISGKIILTFIINKDGSTDKIKIAKSLDEVLDAEAVELIRGYPEWESGQYRGIGAKVEYSIPIKIVSGRK